MQHSFILLESNLLYAVLFGFFYVSLIDASPNPSPMNDRRLHILDEMGFPHPRTFFSNRAHNNNDWTDQQAELEKQHAPDTLQSPWDDPNFPMPHPSRLSDPNLPKESSFYKTPHQSHPYASEEYQTNHDSSAMPFRGNKNAMVQVFSTPDGSGGSGGQRGHSFAHPPSRYENPISSQRPSRHEQLSSSARGGMNHHEEDDSELDESEEDDGFPSARGPPSGPTMNPLHDGGFAGARRPLSGPTMDSPFLLPRSRLGPGSSGQGGDPGGRSYAQPNIMGGHGISAPTGYGGGGGSGSIRNVNLHMYEKSSYDISSQVTITFTQGQGTVQVFRLKQLKILVPDPEDHTEGNPDSELRPGKSITLKAKGNSQGTFSLKADHSGATVNFRGNVYHHASSRKKTDDNGRKMKNYQYGR